MKHIKSFSDFLLESKDEDLTSSYSPPEYLVQPAKGDKGFEMFKKAFDSQKKYFKPSIRSTNQDL
jgi:hypothetical protein